MATVACGSSVEGEESDPPLLLLGESRCPPLMRKMRRCHFVHHPPGVVVPQGREREEAGCSSSDTFQICS